MLQVPVPTIVTIAITALWKQAPMMAPQAAVMKWIMVLSFLLLIYSMDSLQQDWQECQGFLWFPVVLCGIGGMGEVAVAWGQGPRGTLGLAKLKKRDIGQTPRPVTGNLEVEPSNSKIFSGAEFKDFRIFLTLLLINSRTASTRKSLSFLSFHLDITVWLMFTHDYFFVSINRAFVRPLLSVFVAIRSCCIISAISGRCIQLPIKKP